MTVLMAEHDLEVNKVFGGIREGYSDTVVKCPICEFEFNHFKQPRYEYGNDNYESSSKKYRGDMIIIPFRCENGHEWELCFPFHKGNVFPFTRYEE